MFAVTIGSWIKLLLPLAAGIGALVLGLQLSRKKSGAKSAEVNDSNSLYRKALVIGGPILMAVGLALFGLDLVGKGAKGWERRTTSDGKCSAEFPGEAISDRQPAIGPSGAVSRLILVKDNGVTYSLMYADLLDQLREMSAEMKLDNIKTFGPALATSRGEKYEFVSEEKIELDGNPAREIEFAVGGGKVMLCRVFFLGNRIYGAVATVPADRKNSDETQRFLKSIRLEPAA